MSLLEIIRLNFRKSWHYRSKASYLIIPMTLLVACSLIIASEAMNVRKAAETSILGTAEEQARLIKLSKNPFMNQTMGGGGSATVSTFMFSGDMSGQNSYTATDTAKVNAIPGVAASEILTSAKASPVRSTDLFPGADLDLGSLVGLEPAFAPQFTTDAFTYQPGEPIPVILSATGFYQQYEDWQGQQDIEITFPTQGAQSSGPVTVSGGSTGGAIALSLDDAGFPQKTRAIDFDKDTLLGKTFTISVGGLAAPETSTTTPTQTGIKFHKLTDEELAANEQERRDAIAPYWDYDQIKAPLTYTFRVVGILEDQMMVHYVPQAFALQMQKDLIDRQLKARTAAAIDKSLLNQKFIGTNYDGISFKQDMMGLFNTSSAGAVMVASDTTSMSSGNVSFSTSGPAVPMGGPSQEPAISYAIPGLIVEVKRTDSSVIGIYPDSKFIDTLPAMSDTMMVQLNSIYDRSSVVDALNTKGYAYQDLSKTDIFNELQKNLTTVSWGFGIGFVILSIMVISFSMGKFVSEGRREIGVLRALGMSSGSVRTLFLWQSLIYTAVSYILGTALGILLVALLATPLHQWFQDVLGKTIREAFSVVNPVSASAFSHLDLMTFAIESAILLVIVLITSLIPADNAASISPVDAIRGE